MNQNRGSLVEMYRKMVTIRRFEETLTELFYQGKIPGSIHLYIGEEAVGVGACSALSEGDRIVSTHRGHGHLIARGANVKKMMAEILGRETGLNSGKGGSLHVADFSLGIIGACGIVGGGLPIATGAGLASRLTGDGSVAVAFFGDGASNEGSFHESLNLASVWKLPVIFVCENNLYATTTPASEYMSVANVADRAAGYSIRGEIVDGNDVLAVRAAVERALAVARAGDGPSLIDCKTYRWRGHFEGEEMLFPGSTYRAQSEIEEWKLRCPITAFHKRLLEEFKVAADEVLGAEAGVESLMKEAVEFALESPFPAPEKALEHLFAP